MLSVRERDQRYKRRVGFLALASVLIVLVFLSAIQHVRNPFKATYRIQTLVARADNLGADTPVTLAGLRIGTLDAIQLTDDNRVALVLEIDAVQSRKLHADARAKVVRPLIGSPFIDISPGSQSAPPLKPGDVLASDIDADLNAVLATLPARLTKLDQVLDNVQAITADLRQVSGRLAQPQGPLAQTMERGAQAAGKVNEQLDGLARIVKNAEQSSRQAQQMLTDLGQEAHRVGPMLGQIERTLTHGEALAGELRGQGPSLGQAVGQALDRGTETLNDTDDILQAAKKNFLLRGSLPATDATTTLTLPRGR